MNTTATKPAPAGTLKYLHDLIVKKDEQGVSDFAASLPTDWKALWDRVVSGFANCDHEGYGPEALNNWFEMEEWPLLEHSDASKFIEALKKLDWAGSKSTPAKGKTVVDDPVTEHGVYKHGDTFYMVKWNRAGTKLNSYRLVMLKTPEEAKRLAEMGSRKKVVKFVYDGGMVFKLSASEKLTSEQAKAFGALYSSCCQCGYLLTNPLSIALGIGPVCGGRQFGGEWTFMIEEAKLKLEAEEA
jgi:hypothetical protein